MSQPCENPSSRAVVRAVRALTEEQVAEIIASGPKGRSDPDDELHPVREVLSVISGYPDMRDAEEGLVDFIYTNAPDNVNVDEVLGEYEVLQKAISLNPPGFDVEDETRAEEIRRFDEALGFVTTYWDEDDAETIRSFDVEALRDALRDEPSILAQDDEDVIIFNMLLSLSDPDIQTRDLAFENAKAHIRRDVPSADVARVAEKVKKELFDPEPEPEMGP